MSDQTNGNGLPENRKAIADAAATAFQIEYQTVANRRDELQAEVLDLKSQLAIQKELYEIATSQINDMKSRVETMTMQRDEAVAERADAEGCLISINAILRARNTPHAPLVVDKSTATQDALDVMRST